MIGMELVEKLTRPNTLASLGRLKSRLRTVRSYVRFVLVNTLSRNTHNKSKVVVYLDRTFPDIRDRRYFYLILRTLLEAGYHLDVVWKISFRDYRSLYRTYESSIIQLKGMRIISQCPKASKSTMLFTNVAAHFSEIGWRKVIDVDCDISSERHSEYDLAMPYFIHPEQYKYNGRHRLAEIRNRPRQLRIFFSGNIAQEYYSNRLPGNKLTRTEIVQALRTMPGVECPLDERHFQEIFSRGERNGCVIHDRLVFGISDEHWLETIARSDFFLCLPGSRMPMCHNVIEAMSVGAIPILNYGEWFDPPLKHGETCIEFSTLQELRDRIAEILNLDSIAVQAIREKVVKYYEDNLSPRGFRKKLEELPHDHIRVLVNTAYPWETEPELLKALEASVKTHVSVEGSHSPRYVAKRNE
jgi:hypothetical protein